MTLFNKSVIIFALLRPFKRILLKVFQFRSYKKSWCIWRAHHCNASSVEKHNWYDYIGMDKVPFFRAEHFCFVANVYQTWAIIVSTKPPEIFVIYSTHLISKKRTPEFSWLVIERVWQSMWPQTNGVKGHLNSPVAESWVPGIDIFEMRVLSGKHFIQLRSLHSEIVTLVLWQVMK